MDQSSGDDDSQENDEDEEEEDDQHDARSIRSFENMMGRASRRRRTRTRKSLSDRLASTPGLARLSGPQQAQPLQQVCTRFCVLIPGFSPLISSLRARLRDRRRSFLLPAHRLPP